MPSIIRSIDINASPDNVFNYASDPATQADWIRFVEKIDITSGDGKSKGTTDRCVFKLGRRTQLLEGLWTEYEPPRTFARKVTSGLEMESRMIFEPEDDGTRVEWTIDYESPIGMVGALVDALFMNRVFQNEMEESLESLKAQLEG